VQGLEMRIENTLEEGRANSRSAQQCAEQRSRPRRLVARQGSMPILTTSRLGSDLRFCGSQGDIGFCLAAITTRQKGWKNNVDSGPLRLLGWSCQQDGPGEEMKRRKIRGKPCAPVFLRAFLTLVLCLLPSVVCVPSFY